MTAFAQAVYEVVSRIPRGKCMTYTGVAKACGRPKAVRAVGNILNKNRDFKRVPCHRVVRLDGSLGGYVGGLKKKIVLLKKEGVDVKQDKIDIQKYCV